jgi:hypothetical protein
MLYLSWRDAHLDKFKKKKGMEKEERERENYGTERLSISYEVSPMSTTSAHEVGPSIRYK